MKVRNCGRSMFRFMLPIISVFLGEALLAASEKCQALFESSSEQSNAWIIAPAVDGVRQIGVEAFHNGHLITARYVEPIGIKLGTAFLFGQGETAYPRYPFFQQFGFSAKSGVESRGGRRFEALEIRMPDTSALNSVQANSLRKAGTNSESAFTFVPYPYIPKDTHLISAHYAKREIVVYEKPKNSEIQASEDERNVAIFFYHDRNVHVPFWLAAGPEIANSISSRHEVMQKIGAIVKNSVTRSEVRMTESMETEYLDALSALFEFRSAENSIQDAIAGVRSDPRGILEAFDKHRDEEQYEILKTLYILTRNGSELLNYVSASEIYLTTYQDHYGKWVQKSFNIAFQLTAGQKADLFQLWSSLQSMPTTPIERLEAIRLSILDRLRKAPVGAVP